MIRTALRRAVPAVLMLALLVGAALLAAPCLWQNLLARQQNAFCRLTRTDLPGFAPMVSGLVPEGTVRTGDLCTGEVSATLVDETGRSWRLSAAGYSLLWVETCDAGAMVNAHNLRTGESIAFFFSAPENSLGVCPVDLDCGQRVNLLPHTREIFGRTVVEPSFDRRRFAAFARSLQAEEIDPGEVGQDVAFGDGLTVRQSAEFSTGQVRVNGEETAVQLSLFCDPFLFEESPRSTVWVSPWGLAWQLQWFDSAGASLAEEGFCLFADCDGSYVQVTLSREYLRRRGISTTRGALEAAAEALGRIRPAGRIAGEIAA